MNNMQYIRLFCLTLGVCATGLEARAETTTSTSSQTPTAFWKRPVSGNFSDPENWRDGVVPGPEHRVIIALPGEFTVHVDEDTEVKELYLDSLPFDLDMDQDLLPDAWELEHFQDLRQTSAGDFDKDGISNLNEYAQGSDPRSSAGTCFVDGKLLPPDHMCRPQAPGQPCDTPEFCTGLSAECPEDGFASKDRLCRPQDPTKACDTPEFCTGTDPSCPEDQFAPAGQQCRKALAQLACDQPEFCSGLGPDCPDDGFLEAGTACRTKDPSNACDTEELCSGTSPLCPDDTPQTRESGLACAPDPLDIGLNELGVTDYTLAMFGADVESFAFTATPRVLGPGAARLASGVNGLRTSWGIGAKIQLPQAVDVSSFNRIAFSAQSSVDSPNIRLAVELVIDEGGPNQSTWIQREAEQPHLSDLFGSYQAVAVDLQRTHFIRSSGGTETTMDLQKVTGIQFLMLIEPQSGGTSTETAVVIDDLHFDERWLLAGYQSNLPDSDLTEPAPLTVDQFDSGSSSRLALLVTDPSAPWMGLVHGMRAVGIPVRVTTDLDEARKHKVVLAYPSISDRPDWAHDLEHFVEDGGILMGGAVRDLTLAQVFGITEATAVPKTERNYEGREISGIRLTPSINSSLTANFTDAREANISIYRRELGENFDLWRYNGTQEPGLGVYSDETEPTEEHNNVAITLNGYGAGWAIAMGIDLGAYILQAFNGFGGGVGRDYINGYDPSADVLLRLVRNIYTTYNPAAVTVAPLPNDEDLKIFISHDIDTTSSALIGLDYAKMENEAGVKATYFVQTKYISDAQEEAFRGVDAFGALAQLADLNMEVASHSVAHALNFHRFDLGTGTEQYPDYAPVNEEMDGELAATGGSVLGELRVSKSILEDFLQGMKVQSFRPGHLRQPDSLAEAMEAVGYRFASVAAASDTLTHLPHRMAYNRGFDNQTAVFDFPVTVEDERPDSPLITGRVQDAIALADRIARHKGIYVMLVHPNEAGEKLAFVEDFIEATEDRYTFSTFSEFGPWWAARDQVGVDTTEVGEVLVVELTLPEAISGLTLEIPKGRQVSALSQGITYRVDPVAGRLVLTDEVSGKLTIYLR